MDVVSTMDLQHNKEKGIRAQGNFAESIHKAVFAMLKVTLKKDVHLIKQPWLYFMFHAAGSLHCC